jgi:peptidoglycan hydrolase-like protein with peptidoglycan-binding domain
MAAARAADRASVSGYSADSKASTKTSGSMAAARAADRASVKGYSAETRSSTKTSGSMAAARAADRASVKGYSAESSFSSKNSMAAARAADRASVLGYTSGSLRKGTTNDAVRSVQDRLRSAGFNPGKTDGKFGPATEKAVRDFQRSMGLKADGIVGRRTFDALNGTSSFSKNTATRAKATAATTGRPYEAMARLAEQHGLTVTSTTGGRHNTRSKHYQGRAIDVRSRGVSQAQLDAFMADARAHGYTVRDERTRPAGQAVWGGPHIHIER